MKEGSMVKKHKVLIDGQNLEEEDFATEIAGSMGAMATTNFFTVGNMRTRIKKSNNMIAQLQDQLKNAEKNIREEVSKSLEQTRAAERLEIQLLKSSLDEMNQKIQASQVQVAQQKEHAEQLQARLNLMEGRVIDLKDFQTLSLETHTKIEAEQQGLISKIGIVQNYLQEVSESLDNIILLEKEAKAARNTFQKAVACSGNKEATKNIKLSVTEQIKGDIMLKVWETNMSESKKIVKEIKDDCEGILDSLDKQALGIEKDDCSESLGQINIEKQQLDCKEGLKKIQTEILQLKEIDVNLINRWLVQPSLKLQAIKFSDQGFEDRFPKVQRKFYLFETKDLPTPPRNFVHFLEKCIECVASKEGETSTKQ
jgi:hypothetical protein